MKSSISIPACRLAAEDAAAKKRAKIREMLLHLQNHPVCFKQKSGNKYSPDSDTLIIQYNLVESDCNYIFRNFIPNASERNDHYSLEAMNYGFIADFKNVFLKAFLYKKVSPHAFQYLRVKFHYQLYLKPAS